MTKLREARGLDRDELGLLLGISGNMVWRLETGDRQPSKDVLDRLVKVLRTTAQYIAPTAEISRNQTEAVEAV